MRHRRVAGAVASIVVMLGSAAPTPAAQFQASIAGNLGAAENGCTQIIPVFTLYGCAYGNDRVASSGWVGPVFYGAHYAIGSAGDSINHVMTPGDGKIAPGLTGTVTIDDSDTPGYGGDDTVAAQLVIDAAARNIFTGNSTRAVERWTSMTHTMAATAVSAATANAHGGFDYVIGLHGFPELICAAASAADCFASENAPSGLPMPPSFWAGFEPNGIGIERNASQGGNIGAATTAVFQGYGCENLLGGTDCQSSVVVWGALEDPGFDNLLLRIVTNGEGQIVAADGYWTQEFRIAVAEPLPGDNSWIGGTLSFSGQVVPLPAAVWLLASACAILGWARRRR